MISIEQIKQLRGETGVSVIDCKKALEKSGGDFNKAKEILREWGKEVAKKKAEREAGAGLIDSYIHPDKRVGAMLELRCETDFVAKSDDFKVLAHELCLQIAAMDPEKDSLMAQSWIKDESKTVEDLVKEYIAKLGENIKVERFARFEI